MNEINQDLLDALDPARLLLKAGIAPDSWQEEVLRSTAPRIMLNCARGSGKTLVASTLAFHTALYKPGSLTLLVSPTQKQSREVLRVALELWWKAPEASAIASKSESLERLELQNGSRIVSQPGENPDSIRGFHADLAIIDEAARVTDDCFVAVKPTLNIKRGRLLLLSTPFGRRGFFWHEWEEGENWLKIAVNADECLRIPRDRLEEDRISFGEPRFLQEYYCTFSDEELDLFDMELIEKAIVDVPPLNFKG